MTEDEYAMNHLRMAKEAGLIQDFEYNPETGIASIMLHPPIQKLDVRLEQTNIIIKLLEGQDVS